MIFRFLLIAVLLVILLLVVVPFVLYFAGVNIFPSNTAPISVRQKTGVVVPQKLGILMRSQDGGSSWQNAAISENPAISFPSLIYSLVFHPQNPDIMYLGGAQSGLWKSMNGGRTWDKVIDADHLLDLTADVHAIEIARANTDVIYVAAYERNHGRILRSDDSGAHFREVYATSADKKGVFDIVVDGSNVDHVFAVTYEGALIETTNGGKTWRVKKLFTKPLVRLIANPDNIRELYLVDGGGEVFKSVTGGSDWSDPIGKTSQNNGVVEQYPPTIFNFFGSNSSAAQIVFMLDPLNASRVYLGSGKTLLRSEDAGFTWKEVNLLFSKDLLPVTAMAIDPHTSSAIYVAAVQELEKSTDEGATWSNIPLPAGISIKKLIIHPRDSNIIFAVVGR